MLRPGPGRFCLHIRRRTPPALAFPDDQRRRSRRRLCHRRAHVQRRRQERHPLHGFPRLQRGRVRPHPSHWILVRAAHQGRRKADPQHVQAKEPSRECRLGDQARQGRQRGSRPPGPGRSPAPRGHDQAEGEHGVGHLPAAQLLLPPARALPDPQCVRPDRQFALHPAPIRRHRAAPGDREAAQQGRARQPLHARGRHGQSARIQAGRKGGAGDRRDLQPADQEQHHLLELPPPLTSA